jgi:putative Mg2+ transporter-C (MgtC) family protein
VSLSHAEMVARIACGAAFGGVIGYERDVHQRPVGLRTHLIVAMTAATFMVISSQFVYWQRYGHDDLVTVDSSRIAASVVSGIGFLAGGAILRNGFTIQGLTTAAGLWLVAAIGLCAGGGMYVESVAATLVGVAALTMLRRFEDKDDRVRRRLTLTLTEAAITTQALIAKLDELSLMPTLEGWNKESAGAIRQLTLGVRLPRVDGEAQLVAALEAEPGIARMQLDPAV